MENRIRGVHRTHSSLTPAEAEVWFTAVAEHVTPTTEVRGRLVGPRCLYASTVEVAYPLRPLPHPPEGVPPLTVRVVIPEPSFWDPESPFLYRAFVELWQDGQRCDQAGFDVGLRTLDLGARGPYWNGKRLTIRGTTRLPESREEALPLRQAGYNLLLTPIAKPLTWFTAYEVGLLVLGRLPPTETAIRQASIVGGQVSCFAWLLSQDWFDDARRGEELLVLLRQQRHLLGVELDHMPRTPLPEGLNFVVCLEATLPALAALNLPKIVVRETGAGDNGQPDWADAPSVWGWISDVAAPPPAGS